MAAKIGSKNNPEGRGKVKSYMYQGKKIVPAQLVVKGKSRMVAEYYDSKELLLDKNKNPMTWSYASKVSEVV